MATRAHIHYTHKHTLAHVSPRTPKQNEYSEIHSNPNNDNCQMLVLFLMTFVARRPRNKFHFHVQWSQNAASNTVPKCRFIVY